MYLTFAFVVLQGSEAPSVKSYYVDGFDVFVLPGQDTGRVDYLTALVRHALKEKGPDIVHTPCDGRSPSMPAAAGSWCPGSRLCTPSHFGNYPLDHGGITSWRVYPHAASTGLIAVGRGNGAAS